MISELQEQQNLPYELKYPNEITLLKHPLITMHYFFVIMGKYITIIQDYIQKNINLFLSVLILILLPVTLQRLNIPVQTAIEIIYFFIFWILLGISETIGFGINVPTYFFYLLPWIARVCTIANECKSIPEPMPSRWNFKRFDRCPESESEEYVSFFEIFLFLFPEIFLFALGTVIGELPPYFVAKAQAMSSRRAMEDDEEELDPNSFTNRMKKKAYDFVEKYGFIAIIIASALPNVLFDVTGLASGLLEVPFYTFFLATFIGKVIVKANLQLIVAILFFSSYYQRMILQFFEGTEFIRNFFEDIFDMQKSMFQKRDHKKSAFEQVRDYLILFLIMLFMISIINSLVKSYLKQQRKKILAKKQI